MIETEQLAANGALDRNVCRDRWREAFGRPPPKYLSLRFLQRALSYEEQCRTEGGVSRKTVQALSKLASGKGQGAYTHAQVRQSSGSGMERAYLSSGSSGQRLFDGWQALYLTLCNSQTHHRCALVRPALLWAGLMQRILCAIYTRKSSENGLEQEFNSLDAQREVCAAYITSQKAEGWELLPDPYDDGGISGGTMDRPALKRLLSDIDEGKVDRIVVYKIDRLTRSLAGFAKFVDRLDAAKASFVSVTQSFNTATSMGRLTLNMLLSFAQLEREVMAERIRGKLAASKRKGLWMGGMCPWVIRPVGELWSLIQASRKP